MKEMVYTPQHSFEVLEKSFYKGYQYMVASHGTHPCAYVAISKGQPFYDALDYEEVQDINCHGGCTFVEWGYRGEFSENYKVIGWDYAHCEGYHGTYYNLRLRKTKKWTTEEIVKECKEVIDYLHFLEKPELLYA